MDFRLICPSQKHRVEKIITQKIPSFSHVMFFGMKANPNRCEGLWSVISPHVYITSIVWGWKENPNDSTGNRVWQETRAVFPSFDEYKITTSNVIFFYTWDHTHVISAIERTLLTTAYTVYIYININININIVHFCGLSSKNPTLFLEHCCYLCRNKWCSSALLFSSHVLLSSLFFAASLDLNVTHIFPNKTKSHDLAFILTHCRFLFARSPIISLLLFCFGFFSPVHFSRLCVKPLLLK